MCKILSSDLYCTNFKCSYNLFWEELNLERDKIQMTLKALQIRNCCRRVIRPWTPEEISEAWGLTNQTIKKYETIALKKVKKKYLIKSNTVS